MSNQNVYRSFRLFRHREGHTSEKFNRHVHSHGSHTAGNVSPKDSSSRILLRKKNHEKKRRRCNRNLAPMQTRLNEALRLICHHFLKESRRAVVFAEKDLVLILRNRTKLSVGKARKLLRKLCAGHLLEPVGKSIRLASQYAKASFEEILEEAQKSLFGTIVSPA